MTKSETIKIQVGDTVVELNGNAKAEFIADRDERVEAERLFEAEYKAKQDARGSALKKLGDIAGLTKAELDSIL